VGKVGNAEASVATGVHEVKKVKKTRIVMSFFVFI
jgi:hypothetical protein